jgi:hypothetical protein
MAKLKIEFQFLFLLVNHDRGGIVALPSKHHHCTITHVESGRPQPLAGHQVDIVEIKADGTRGSRLFGRPSDRPSDEPVVHMRNIFGTSARAKREVVAGKVDRTLMNARIVLGGGTFTGQPASKPAFRNTPWRFHKPNGGFLTQRLTDRLDYEVTLDDAKQYEVWFTGTPRIDPMKLPSGQTNTLRVVNTDVKSSGSPQADAEDEDYELKEFHLLYDLLVVGPRPGGPFGRGEAGHRRPIGPRPDSVDDPICGGGQGDPPDPPADPPDPEP